MLYLNGFEFWSHFNWEWTQRDIHYIQISVVGELLSHQHAKNLFSERVVKVWDSLLLSIVIFSLATFRNSLTKISFRI